VHYREPAQLVPLGLAVVHAAGEGTAGAAAGWLFVALGRRFAGEREAAHEAQMQAQRLARLHEAEDVLANLRDLQAMSLNVSGQPAQALALLALNDSPGARARSVHERCLTHARRAAAHDGLGHRD
jgi:hypothetical protein